MPSYEYRCQCRTITKTFEDRDDPVKDMWDRGLHFCESCTGEFKRQWSSFQSARPGVIGEGYVMSAFGDRRMTSREIEREAARVSEEYTARTGLETNLVPVSWDDPAVKPKDDEGLKEQHDGMVARGEKDTGGKFL